MSEARVGTEVSPFTGRPMNCTAWGTYENPGTSPTDPLCNGGTVDGELWMACPSRDECRRVRNERVLQDARTRLPQVPNGPSGPPASRVTVVNSPTRTVSPYGSNPYSSTSASLPQRAPSPGVITPNHENPYLDSPRAAAPTDHSPTYLPHPEEHPGRRLIANMLIGSVESVAHHISSFLRNVDIFPYRGPKK